MLANIACLYQYTSGPMAFCDSSVCATYIGNSNIIGCSNRKVFDFSWCEFLQSSGQSREL